jgi:hypothetical protein
MHWIDPAQLPLVKGTIERFTMNGQGELDGLVLDIDDDAIKLIHFPSYMAANVEALLKPGDRIGIRGLKARDAEIIAAVAFECVDGTQIIDCGPPKHERISIRNNVKPVPMSAAGRVRLTLFTPKGKVRGVLLDEGTILRFTLRVAEEIRERLKPSTDIEVQGVGFKTPHGRVIEVHHLATPKGKFEVVAKSHNISARRSHHVALGNWPRDESRS